MIPLKDTIPHRGFPLMTWTIILLNGIIFIFEISIPKDLLQQLFYLFGSRVEDQMGHIRFLIFYFLSGIAASVIYFLVDIHSTIPEFGASGAIAGVMGAYIVMFPKARILTVIPIFFFPFLVEISAFFYIGYWFILQLFSGTLSFAFHSTQGGIAWWAHIGGFIVGIVLLPFFRKRDRSYRNIYPDETYHHISH